MEPILICPHIHHPFFQYGHDDGHLNFVHSCLKNFSKGHKFKLLKPAETLTYCRHLTLIIVVLQPFNILTYSAISDCRTWTLASKLGVTEWILVYPASTNAVQVLLAMHYGCMFL